MTTPPVSKLTLSVLLFCLLPLAGAWAQYDRPNLDETTAAEAAWVDSVFQSMTPEQRLGQLFMIRAYSNQGTDHVAAVERMIREYHVGGLCFFQGTPEEQIKLTNRYQGLSTQVPLMIAIDGEWGLGMRLKTSTISYPRQIMLGAIRDNSLLYDMGRQVGDQLKRIGVHVNFAPVVDINNNPDNPVIGYRSFGEDRFNVTAKSYEYMRGMQAEGIMACAKHFPGHGDTNVDSHEDLPVIRHDRDRLDSIELFPFRTLVQKGVGSIMVGHLQVPALDERAHRPTSLSQATVHDLLRDDLQFHGLAFTDGLGMQGAAKHYAPGEIEAEALLAGNDVLVLPQDLEAARNAIVRYVEEGKISGAAIDRHVKRILRAKYRLGLTRFEPIAAEGVRAELNSADALSLKQTLTEQALTLVRNEGRRLPLESFDSLRLAALAIGIHRTPAFQERLSDYADIDLLRCGNGLSTSEQEDILRRLRQEDLVIVSLHGMTNSSGDNFGLKASTLDFLEQLRQQNKVILVVFGNPYSLRNFDRFGDVLLAYDEETMTQEAAAQGLFGAIGLNGRLPVTASARSPFNAGVSTSRNYSLGFATPERMGMNGALLRQRIDAIAEEAIEDGATPGCVVLVARHGRIVFNQAYGYHDYKRTRAVQASDIYDLASITKVAATTLALMDLSQRGLIDLDQTLGYYLPDLVSTNKNALTLREIMAHRAGLQAWIPFYTSTMEGRRPSGEVYRHQATGAYNVEVTDHLYMRYNYVDSIFTAIAESELRGNNNYRYSDLGFYLLARLVEEVACEPLDSYVYRHFYQPLGLHDIAFRPHEHFALSRIPPTEEDHYFRNEQIKGYVHDMGAAMLGGVSGHAGLFANAHDLAVLMQMLMQHGYYGGRQYLTPGTVREYTSRFPGATRRGLGFDMKQLDPGRSLNVAAEASPRTFGHQGFTGTCVWADPAEELVFVFLSNRTYPSMRNNKLARLDIRERMQAAAYQAITVPHKERAVDRIATSALPEQVQPETVAGDK
ncbi:MAG: serine hydrolase [Lewinella sp.]|nr:serine hydrolase [Lewinella sp.]